MMNEAKFKKNIYKANFFNVTMVMLKKCFHNLFMFPDQRIIVLL